MEGCEVVMRPLFINFLIAKTMDNDYSQALNKCLANIPAGDNTPAALVEYGFVWGYMEGQDNGYRSGIRNTERKLDARRLMVATAAMQGLLAGGYLAEHSDTAAEAVRQADALLAKLGEDKTETYAVLKHRVR